MTAKGKPGQQPIILPPGWEAEIVVDQQVEPVAVIYPGELVIPTDRGALEKWAVKEVYRRFMATDERDDLDRLAFDRFEQDIWTALTNPVELVWHLVSPFSSPEMDATRR